MISVSWAIILALTAASRSAASGLKPDDEPLVLGDPDFLDLEVPRDVLVAALRNRAASASGEPERRFSPMMEWPPALRR
jgi:hypothetical protein